MTTFEGVWLPIITPFVDGEIDFASYERLVEHYVQAGIDGLVVLGTTGESPTVDDDERDALVERTIAVVAGRVPVVVGAGGNDTRKVVEAVRHLERHDPHGILSVCPYYSRPSQDGLREHFTRVAAATDRPILIYNVPYRTGVNLENETLLALAALRNVVGAKDSAGDVAQSLDLLRRRPDGFAVLTGEDAHFHAMLGHGADGGILASAHLETASFRAVGACMAAGDREGARRAWTRVEPLIPLLFGEPNPMPIKHCLWRQGLIRSPECRLPLTRVSDRLAHALDLAVARADG